MCVLYVVILILLCIVLMADMTRQYKAMQNELTVRIQQLEADLSRTRTQLGTACIHRFHFYHITYIQHLLAFS